jgi:hypothetical protein
MYQGDARRRAATPISNAYKIKETMQKAAEGEAPAPRPSPKEETAAPQRPPRQSDRREPPYGRESRGSRSEFGTLRLRTQPGDATVRVDGQEWDRPSGDDPLVIDLAAGTHRVEVRKDGFRPYTREVEIRPGDTTTLNVSLPEESSLPQ